MAFYDLLHKFHYIEPNNLKALLPGFVVAQMEVAAEAKSLCVRTDGHENDAEFDPREEKGLDGWFMENGTICSISEKGIIPWANGLPMFIVYNDPLNTIRQGDEYYATELRGENPRLVQLIPGDEWMADGKASDHKGLEAAIASGLVVEVDIEKNKYSNDDWFDVDYMPNGDEGKHYLFVGGKAA